MSSKLASKHSGLPGGAWHQEGKGRTRQTRNEGPVISPTFPLKPLGSKDDDTFNGPLRARYPALGL